MNTDIIKFVLNTNRRTLGAKYQRTLHTVIRLQANSPTGWVTLGTLRSSHIDPMTLRNLRRPDRANLEIDCRRTETGVEYRLNTRHLTLTRVQRVLES